MGTVRCGETIRHYRLSDQSVDWSDGKILVRTVGESEPIDQKTTRGVRENRV